MIGLPLIFIIAVSVVGGTIDLQGLIDSMKEKPPAEVAILFIIVMTIGTVLFVPALVLTLASL